MRDNRPGCIQGLFEMFLLDSAFNWLERNFGFGRGCSCSGCGCGIIVLIVFVLFACSVLTGTNWLKAF